MDGERRLFFLGSLSPPAWPAGQARKSNFAVRPPEKHQNFYSSKDQSAFVFPKPSDQPLVSLVLASTTPSSPVFMLQ